MWRALETELRRLLIGHEGGNAGYSQAVSYEFVASALDPTNQAVTVKHDITPAYIDEFIALLSRPAMPLGNGIVGFVSHRDGHLPW
jgi:hypothetical protein